jgi:REP element-mobilizing transposase RayT
LLDQVVTRCGWRVFAWVLMTNHFHLFVRTPEANLSAGVHDLNSGYASLFNRRYRRAGSLFQGRFKAVLVESETHSWELSRYIHLNPVRTRIVQRARDYRWSSYPAYLDRRKAPDWLDWETVVLERAKDLARARAAYRRFVEAAVGKALKSPLEFAVGGAFLGSSDWVDQMRARLAEEPDDPNVPNRRRLAARPSTANILAVVADQFDVDARAFGEVRRHDNEARNAAVYLHRRLTNEPLRALAKRFGNVSTSAISKLTRRAESRRREDPAWDRLLRRLEIALQHSR